MILFETGSKSRTENINLYPASINTVRGIKWGYMNNKGKMILKADYDSASDFDSSGIAIVRVKGLYGTINSEGKYIVTPRYGSISQFSEGLSAVTDKEGFRVIDKSGKVITTKAYSFIGDFNNGRALFGTVAPNGKYLYGYLDSEGKEVIPAKFESAGNFKSGKAVVRLSESQYALIGINGNVLNVYHYSNVGDLGDGLLAYQKSPGEKFGYINEDGTVAIPPKFSWASVFSDGRAVVNMSDIYTNLMGLINKTGEFIIKPQYNDIRILGENRVAVGKAIDKDRPYIGSRYSIADSNGRFFTGFLYNGVSDYKDGIASAFNDYYTFFIDTIGRPVKRLPTVEGSGTMQLLERDLVRADVDFRMFYLGESGNIIRKQNTIIPLSNKYWVREGKFKPNKDYLVYYPEVQGMENKLSAQTVNKRLKDLSEVKYINGNVQLDYSYLGTFSVSFFKKDLLVLQLDGYKYYFGAAHGMPTRIFPSINLISGRFYELKDLFKDNSDYVKVLSDIIGNQIKNNEQYSYVFPGSYKGINPDQPFFVKEDALYIYFYPYEIAPYAAGFPTFKIPYKDIMDIIDTKGSFWKSFNL